MPEAVANSPTAVESWPVAAALLPHAVFSGLPASVAPPVTPGDGARRQMAASAGVAATVKLSASAVAVAEPVRRSFVRIFKSPCLSRCIQNCFRPIRRAHRARLAAAEAEAEEVAGRSP